MQEVKKNLSKITSAMMISTALFYDGLQAILNLIPFLGQMLSSLITIFACLTFYLWFKLHDINFSNPKRVGYLGGGLLIELVPILNILPAWTLAVTLLTLNVNMQKKLSDNNTLEA